MKVFMAVLAVWFANAVVFSIITMRSKDDRSNELTWLRAAILSGETAILCVVAGYLLGVWR